MHSEPGSDTLLYLYGIVRNESPEPPDSLVGLEGGQVALLPSGDLSAVVSRVPVAIYGEEDLNDRLDDLVWVGERGIVHEQVLDWFASAGPVIPLSLFSLHEDEARIAARLKSDEQGFVRLLDRLEGRKEWGIKVWRDDAAAEGGVDQLSPSLQALSDQIAAAPEGKRFLLERKRDTMRAEELRAASKRISHEVYAALASAADGVHRAPIPQGVNTERTLMLSAAFLVEDQRFDQFRAAVSEQAGRLVGSGFEIEFSGPWPPYHFSDPGDD